MEEKIKKAIKGIVDLTTGELEKIIYEGDRARITRKESIDHDRSTRQLNDKEDFIKIYLKPMMLLSRTLSGSECTLLFYMLQYLNFKTGMLHYNRGSLLTREHIAEDLGQNIRTVDRVINMLTENEIICKAKVGKNIYFFMNPFVFMRGRRVNYSLIALFMDSAYAKLYDGDYRLIADNETAEVPELNDILDKN